MKFISVDIETTGLDFEQCNIVELAAIAVDTEKPLVFEECPKLRVLCGKYDDHFFLSPRIALMHRYLWPQFEDESYPRIREENVVLALNAFISSLGPDKAVFAGKNAAGFDLPFINESGKHCSTNGCREPEKVNRHHRTLDPGSMYTIYSDQVPPDLKTCLSRAGLELTQAHTALGDAWDVARLVYKDLTCGNEVPKVLLPEQIEFAMKNSPVPLLKYDGSGVGRNWW